MKNLPPSEFRRLYMKRLRQELEFYLRLPPKEAKLIAQGIVQYFHHKVYNAEEVDLGFMKISPKKIKAREFRINFPGRSERFLQGETVGWRTVVHESWQREQRPPWSKFCAPIITENKPKDA